MEVVGAKEVARCSINEVPGFGFGRQQVARAADGFQHEFTVYSLQVIAVNAVIADIAAIGRIKHCYLRSRTSSELILVDEGWSRGARHKKLGGQRIAVLPICRPDLFSTL